MGVATVDERGDDEEREAEEPSVELALDREDELVQSESSDGDGSR